MARFIGRRQELAELQDLLDEPRAQFLAVYGRRRVGKTTLLLHWARQSGAPFVYWVSSRMSPAILLRGLSQALYNSAHPDRPADSDFSYPSWEMALRQAAEMARDRRLILILDEFPYAAQAEPGLPSVVQNVWDHDLKDTRIFLVVAGSQVGMMVNLLNYQAPLYGRFTAHLHLKPLPFSALAGFFPRYTLEQRIAVYAILGGIPAYLERFDDAQTIAVNVQRRIFRPSGIFRAEPFFLLQDEVREPRNFMAVLRAIGEGNHTLETIARAAGLPRQNVSTYLGRLRDLYLIERRLPVTLPPPQRRPRSHRGRWHLRDSYLRFYFRFIEPHQHLLEMGLVDRLWEIINEQMRAFVGTTAFEDLCREWVIRQATTGDFPFLPDDVGSHWSAETQVDVVAVNWPQKAILLGEAKWGTEPLARKVLIDLLDKTPLVVPDEGRGWQIHYALFARAGFTEATRQEAAQHDVILVDLQTLGETLEAEW